MSDKERVYIFDTTLRDGQQSPGAGLAFEDNLIYADHAEKLKVDVLEAGFPSASQTDYHIVKTIASRMAERGSTMTIAGLCQLREKQVDKTIEALEPAINQGIARVHTYVPVDPNLVQASLGHHAQSQDLVHTVYRLVKKAKDAGCEVEFSPEGYSRVGENFDYVTELMKSAVEAGVDVINCPDTIGGACRRQGKDYFVHKLQQHADILHDHYPEHSFIFSTHNHNDFGLALDNSINAVMDGPARQIEGCINGVGERAGNAALEQCVMYLRAFGHLENANGKTFYTNVDVSHLKPISDFIADKMLPRQPHSPIVGGNSAKHTSGGHTNAVLNNPLAYQPFDPTDVGSQVSLVFGPLSGSNHARQVIEDYGYVCDNQEKGVIAQAIKDYYHDRRKGITDIELIQAYKYYRAPIKPTNIRYARDNEKKAQLVLEGTFFGQNGLEVSYHGKSSALAALDESVKTYMPDIELYDYHSQSTTPEAANAVCRSSIVVKSTQNGQTYKGVADDKDIEISALKAYIEAINEAYIDRHYRLFQTQSENQNERAAI
jgi:2-isopropylmalate synthase